MSHVLVLSGKSNFFFFHRPDPPHVLCYSRPRPVPAGIKDAGGGHPGMPSPSSAHPPRPRLKVRPQSRTQPHRQLPFFPTVLLLLLAVFAGSLFATPVSMTVESSTIAPSSKFMYDKMITACRPSNSEIVNDSSNESNDSCEDPSILINLISSVTNDLISTRNVSSTRCQFTARDNPTLDGQNPSSQFDDTIYRLFIQSYVAVEKILKALNDRNDHDENYNNLSTRLRSICCSMWCYGRGLSDEAILQEIESKMDENATLTSETAIKTYECSTLFRLQKTIPELARYFETH